MKLYHGTSSAAAVKIIETGLIRGGPNRDTYYNYLAPTPEQAGLWGDVVVEVNVPDEVCLGTLQEDEPVWEILCPVDILPERCRIWSA